MDSMDRGASLHVDAVLVIDLLLELLGLIGRDAVQLANNLARLIETHLDLQKTKASESIPQAVHTPLPWSAYGPP